MTDNELVFLKNWFSDYCKSFYSENEEDQRNITLKEKHTHEVCKNIALIAKEHSAEPNDILIAEATALFHDLGRFPQYARYKTFRDSVSVNHGKLGAEILEQEDILKALSEDEREIIIQSVRFHNAFAIPCLQNHKHIHFIKLIRDADKLDIWRVFIEYFENSKGKRASAAVLDLPESPEYSERVISCIYKKQIATLAELKTTTDFKILLLSWIYDLNFSASLRLLSDKGYMQRIASELPQTKDIKKASEILEEFVRNRLEG